jgi:hypothetical protein
MVQLKEYLPVSFSLSKKPKESLRSAGLDSG